MKCRAMLLLFSGLVLRVANAQVVLNEVMFNPLGTEATDEFVEIFNVGEDAVELAGWKIGDGSGEDALIESGAGTLLLPGRFGLILDPDYFATSTTYDSLIPDTCLRVTLDGTTFGSSGLSNSQAETVSLIDPAGRIVDSHIYDIGFEAGHSSERMYWTGTPDPDAWGQSRSVNGTPGAPSSVTKWETDVALIGPIFLSSIGESREIAARLANVGRASVSEAAVHFYHDADRDEQISPAEEVGTIQLENSLPPGDTVWAATPWDDAPSGLLQLIILTEAGGDQCPENNLLIGEVMAPFSPGCLVINEIMFQPLAGEPEWFELFNRSDISIDLSGWQFSDSDTNDTVLLTEKEIGIVPNGFAVVASDSSIVLRIMEDVPIIIPPRFPGLNNDYDAVFLRDPTGRIIDQVPLEGAWLQSRYVSLERLDPDRASNDPQNWYRCTDIHGMTPGRVNSVYTERPTGISELSVSPNPFSPDGDGHEDVAAISYRLPHGISTLRIRIYDVLGRCVKTLRSGNPSGAEGTVLWEGSDDSGKPAQIGIYIVHLEALGTMSDVAHEEKTILVVAGEL